MCNLIILDNYGIVGVFTDIDSILDDVRVVSVETSVRETVQLRTNDR